MGLTRPMRANMVPADLPPMLIALALLTTPVLISIPQRPWPPVYKISPSEKKRLTPADVVGPDGLVYPDWRHAGVPGGIPDVAVRVELAAYGGVADDGKDDSAALRKAVAAAVAKGGGAVELGSGVYHLDRPVVITDDAIVIRGAGRDRTRLLFRYELPARPRFVSHTDGARIGPSDVIELRGRPDVLKKLRFFVGDEQIEDLQRPAAMAKTFRLVILAERLIRVVGTGRHVIEAVEVPDKVDDRSRADRVVARLAVEVTSTGKAIPGKVRFSRHLKGLGALSFCGDGTTDDRWSLAADGRRGERHLTLVPDHGLRRGDRVAITAPPTRRWNQLVRNACKWGEYRVYYFRVEAVDGARITLNQPLRYPFPVADGAFVRRIHPIRRCGVEDLTIAQTSSPWTCGVFFCDAWECWVKGVSVERAGRMPFLLEWGKWCEVRDCVFDGAREVGGGGTGYVGWQRATDCLMTDVLTRGMRHAPLVEWAASGNVIRDSRFEGSDMQWHAGWTNENLFENCTVVSTRKFGGYGFGAWASPPGDRNHGPNGPRNVVYNCDIRSPRAGLWLGGSNEAWLFVGNRFIVDKGPGMIVQQASFDHILRGNVFVLLDRTKPLVFARNTDCVGIELLQNRIYGGNGQLAEGVKVRAVGNSIHELKVDAGRPDLKVPSIFLWQRKQR